MAIATTRSIGKPGPIELNVTSGSPCRTAATSTRSTTSARRWSSDGSSARQRGAATWMTAVAATR